MYFVCFSKEKMNCGLILFLLACSSISAYTLYDRCIKQCSYCRAYWGDDLFDVTVCKTYCVLTKGGSRNSTKCTVGAKVQKRAKTHTGTMECQKYCAGCIYLYGKSFYDGYKCSVQCIESKGKTTDTDCTLYSMFVK